MGGSVSGIALILLAAYKCAFTHLPAMHLLRKPAQARLKQSLPCVKGGGTACRDGGIVKNDNSHKTIPQSASLTAPFTQGSLWHKKILR